MSTRWQPWTNEMHRLHDEMNRLFDRWVPGARPLAQTVYPPLNLWEDDEHFYVEAELPGLALSDLEILVSGDNQLSIKGDRKQPELGKGAWHRQERGYGTFGRTVELPSPVNSDAVSAQFQHGVLTITLPKREEVKPRRIEVKVN